MDAQRLPQLSLSEYVKLEEETGIRYEFHDGYVFAMAGGSINHGLISTRLIVLIGMGLLGAKRSCTVINNDVKLAIAVKNRYLYPDLSVVCGDIERSNDLREAIGNPILIVEVLSKSTAAYDRGDKLYLYRQLPSLQEYLIVEQDKPHVDLYQRDGDTWRITTITGLSSRLKLDSIEIELALADIYDKITFLPGPFIR